MNITSRLNAVSAQHPTQCFKIKLKKNLYMTTQTNWNAEIIGYTGILKSWVLTKKQAAYFFLFAVFLKSSQCIEINQLKMYL